MRNILVNNNNKGSKSYQNQNNKNAIPIYNSSINLNFDKMNTGNNNNSFSSGNLSPKNNHHLNYINFFILEHRYLLSSNASYTGEYRQVLEGYIDDSFFNVLFILIIILF